MSPMTETATDIHKFLINGSDDFGMSKEIHKVYYPADQATVVGECYLAQAEHIELILKSAKQGFRDYRFSTVMQRIAILEKLAALLEKNMHKLSELITREAGKPITMSEVEVKRAVEVCRGYANYLKTEPLEKTYYLNGRQSTVRQFPLGPVLAITPFNFPLNLAIHKLCPAIASGCSFTLKPPPQAPLTGLYLGRLCVEAGYGAISVIPTTNEVAEQLVMSGVFEKISFTGSAKVGWHLKSLASNKSVTLELGGNAAVMIEDFSKPVEEIAQRVAYGAFAYAGQICISVQRVLVNQRLLGDFMPPFKQAVRDLKVGDPMDRNTVVGPIITLDDLQRTRGLIKAAIHKGANAVYGGNTYNMVTLNPIVLDRTTPEMAVNCEEVFAPIATVATYNSFEEGLAMVNASKYGLQAGVYVNDPVKIKNAYNTLDVGGVMINEVPAYRIDELPYGGIKQSGIGREGIFCGIREYTYEKTLIH